MEKKEASPSSSLDEEWSRLVKEMRRAATGRAAITAGSNAQLSAKFAHITEFIRSEGDAFATQKCEEFARAVQKLLTKIMDVVYENAEPAFAGTLERLFILVYDVASASTENTTTCSGLLARHTLEVAVGLNTLNASSFAHLRAQREALSTLQILLPSGMLELRKWINDSVVRKPLRELAGSVMAACGDYSVQSLVSELVYRIQKSGIKLDDALGADTAFVLRSFQRVVRKRRVDDLLRDLRIFINEYNEQVLANECSVTSFRLLSVAVDGNKFALGDDWVDFGHNHCTIYLDEHGQSLPVDIPYDALEHVNIRGGSTTTAHVCIAMRSVPDIVKSTFAPDGKVEFEFDEHAADIERLLEARKPGRDMKIDSQGVSEEDEDEDNLEDGGNNEAVEKCKTPRGGRGGGGSSSGTFPGRGDEGNTNVKAGLRAAAAAVPAASNFEMSDVSDDEREQEQGEGQKKRQRAALALQVKGLDRRRSAQSSRAKRPRNLTRKDTTKAAGSKKRQRNRQQKQDHSPVMSARNVDGAMPREMESARRRGHRINAPRRPRERAAVNEGSPNCTDLVVYNRGGWTTADGGISGGVYGDEGALSEDADLAKVIGRRRESMKVEANSALRETFREIRAGLKVSLQDIHDGVSEHRRSMLKMCNDRLGGFETKLVKQVSGLSDRQNAFAEQMAEDLAVHKTALRSLEETMVDIEETLEKKSRELLERVSHVESEANALVNNTEHCVRQAIRGMNNTATLKSVINAML